MILMKLKREITTIKSSIIGTLIIMLNEFHVLKLTINMHDEVTYMHQFILSTLVFYVFSLGLRDWDLHIT